MYVPAPVLMPGHNSQRPFHPALEQAIEVLEEGTVKDNYEVRNDEGHQVARPYAFRQAECASRRAAWSCSVKRQERAKRLQRCRSITGRLPAANDAQAMPMRPRTPLDQAAIAAADNGEYEYGADGGGRGWDTHWPAKRYRLTDQMKTLI
ncbi:hypothetical protein DICSQDRAFT_180667 [Dichomitus squalens LYAD-421 SS1]|uniref:Uncharacterized protein n=1 Tax=Dichomitus squalens (strain LYAD-421) TaxID=732165 RepID=R7SYU1_DICSQ|nr:uncharacterized protein DICSQDRAFT_180667 [Dichomitus squalens LYAD-421 SS1]EJF61354.1 hypothetical protein DICSQDRAFT_180667 [Dichomitus squalens LYAD-421 SS1]